MKKILLLFSSVLLVLPSCQREMPGQDAEETHSIYGTIDKEDAVTRSILVDNPGIKLESRWQDGDVIGYFGGDARNGQLALTAGSISANGKTALFTSPEEIPSSDLISYSPYQERAKMEGGELVLYFPATQHFRGAAGVSTPDSEANILVGTGNRNAGLQFRSLLAVLKIGQVFEQDGIIDRVEFRDLDGKPVSGEMRVDPADPAQTAFTGDGKVLTLDFGNGLEVEAGSLQPFYLIVPARNYSKGFEVKFVLRSGSPIVRTVGTKMGKELQRGVIYPVGEMTQPAQAPDAHSQLDSKARIVTPELMDLAQVLSTRENYLKDENGSICYDVNGSAILLPEYDMLVHKDFQPETGGLLLFDMPTDDLPYGGVYKIASCEKVDDTYFRIYVKPEANVFAPFKELTTGDPIFDADGNFLEGGGVEIDLAGSLQSITDENGRELTFSAGPDGGLYFGEEETAGLLGLDTKAMFKHKFTIPGLDVNLKSHNDSQALTCEATFSSKMTLEMKAAAKIIDGTLQYLHFTAQPALELKGAFSLKAAVEKSLTKHIYTMHFAPIPIAPGVLLVPTIDFEGGVSVGGSLKFTTSLSYTYDFGMYGFSYNNGDGFTFRHHLNESSKDDGFNPEIDGAEGTLYASAHLIMTPTVSLYGLLGAGVQTNIGLQFGISSSSFSGGGVKLALTPSIEFTPKVASLGGCLTYTFKEFTGSIPFDPIWERWLTPYGKRTNIDIGYEWTEEGVHLPEIIDYDRRIPKSMYATYDFLFEHPTLSGFDVAIYVYEAAGAIKWSTARSRYPDGTTTYDYYPDYPDKGRIFYFDKFVGAGYAHLWPFVALKSVRYEVGSWNLAERIVVGRFVEGKEEPQEFKGDVPFHFQPGTLYRLTGKLIGALGEFGDTAVRYNNNYIEPIPYFY